jgi:HAMP domain-containing protein
MNLLVRINLALGSAFIIAGLGVGYAGSRLLEANAQGQLVREARLMMDSAASTRAYTSEEILPLLNEAMKTSFLPQSIPFYAATQNFIKLRQQHPEYAYKEATLNPTNPRDRATDWEADLIQQFRNSGDNHELVGERDTPMGRSLFMARPIRVGPECLECHSSPHAAPATLVTRYGIDNGFGWQLNEVVGAQVISVPLSATTADAQRTWRRMMLSIGAAFVFLLFAFNGIAYWFFVRPVRRIARVADAVSQGNAPAEGFPTGGGSEITALSRAFNRMRVSLEKAMKLLEG